MLPFNGNGMLSVTPSSIKPQKNSSKDTPKHSGGLGCGNGREAITSPAASSSQKNTNKIKSKSKPTNMDEAKATVRSPSMSESVS
jgi:hypothetical protein